MSRKSSALFEKISPLSKNTKNPASTNTRDLIVREEKLHWTRRRSYKAYGTFGVSRREGERVQKYKEATRKTLAVARETSGNICPRFFSTSSRRYSAVRTLSTLDIPPAGVVAFLDFRVCLSLASALTSSCHALVTATSLLYPRLPPRCHSHSAYVCGTRVTQACEDARSTHVRGMGVAGKSGARARQIYRRHPHAYTRCVRSRIIASPCSHAIFPNSLRF